LCQAKTFDAVFRFKRQARGNFVQIYAMPNGLPFSRLGLIVPKKIERGAVKRNRIKRQLREMFRTFQSGTDNTTVQMDWIMRIRRPVTTDISRAQFTAEVRLLMHRLQLCHD